VIHPIAKRIIGALLVGGALSYYLYFRIFLQADSSIVVAPGENITAPCDGILSHSLTSFTLLPPRAEVASVQQSAGSNPDLQDARAELDTARGDAAALKDFISIGEALNAKAASREVGLRTERTEHLRRVVGQADAALKTQQATMDGAVRVRDKSEKLCQAGLMSALECDTARVKAEVATRDVAATQQQADIARFLLTSSERGLDVGQVSASEATYARQRRDELTLKLATLRHDLAVDEAKIHALEARIAEPAVKVSTVHGGRVWSILRQSQGFVTKGEPLLQLADCSRLYVLASVKQGIYEKIRYGAAAIIKVGGRTYKGTVAQVLGSAGDFVLGQTRFPVNPPVTPDFRSAFGLVAVKSDELATDLAGSCEIGTAVEVTFSRSSAGR
jgi:multidrug resistance efflux pump